MKKIICHISTVHAYYDTRIFYKECRSLVKQGYKVYFIVSYDGEEKEFEGVNIIPIGSSKNRFYRFFIKKWVALKKAIQVKADLYHIHDPELIIIAVILRLLGKKVIYDVHENVPMQILNKDYLGNIFIRKVVSNLFNIFEKFNSYFMTAIITARPDISERFSKEKVIVVRNFPVLTSIDKVEPRKEKAKKEIVIYAGMLTEIRGIREIIQSMVYLNGKVELWLFGDWDDSVYHKECMNLDGYKYVKEYGFIPQDEVYSYMKISNIGIVNFWNSPNHIRTLPNKPFEYMACSIPMVMSNFQYWKEIFKGCYLSVNPKSPKDIAKNIEYLIENKKIAKEMGKTGRKLIEDKYSWEAERNRLFKLYDDILDN